MGNPKQTDPDPKSPGHPRRPYVRPELRELGAVENLTRNQDGAGGDGPGPIPGSRI